MNTPRFALMTGLLLAGCTVTQPRPSPAPVPLAYGSASSFTPLVGATSTPSSCVEVSEATLEPGAQALALHYSGPPKRQVTVTLNAAGEPIRYIDVRGDLTRARSPALDRTTIGLYLEQGYAVLSNRQGAQQPTMLEVRLEEVLTSSRLGNPTAVMLEVLDACGSPETR